MQAGSTPSVSDVAEAAEVSRATAYRYFPSQAAMVQAAVDEALGPILTGAPSRTTPRRGSRSCSTSPIRASHEYEATLRAALMLALEQWARRQAGTLGDEARIVRGNRASCSQDALAPLKGDDRAAQAFDRCASRCRWSSASR